MHYGWTVVDADVVGVTDAAPGSDSIDEVLRTALDLCLGLGAFVVSTTGAVHRVLSDAMPPEDGWRRIEVLARNCLSHPAAHGQDLFWNAEVSTEAGSADRSLACVVMPVWSGDTQLGLLGVVDTWLPEPDGYQRTGLAQLSSSLARLLPRAPAPGPAPESEPEAQPESEPGAPAQAEPEPVPEASAHSEPVAPPERGGDVGAESSSIDAVELVHSLDDGIMCLDADGTVVLTNGPADAMHGLRPERSLLGSMLPASSGLRTEDGEPIGRDDHPGTRVLRDGVAREAHLTLGEEGDGQRRVRVWARPFPIGGRRGALVVLRDTTAEWAHEQSLTHDALYDPLTGLANRRLLVVELRRMLQGIARRGGSVALVHVQIADFERVSDEHGPETADEVLGAFARRLRGAVRSDDVVARLSAAVFVVAHSTADRSPDGDLVVSRVRKVLSAPFTVKAGTFDLGTSVGWVSADKAEADPDELLARAERAMIRHRRDLDVAGQSTS